MTCLAIFSLSTTTRRSPADGTCVKPFTATGMDGGADFMLLPLSSTIWRILPYVVPDTT